jgi:hypothetical protein
MMRRELAERGDRHRPSVRATWEPSIEMRGRKRKPIFQLLLLASCILMPGCDNTPPTDCHEMRTSQGLRADGTACTCTYFFGTQNGTPKPPACHVSCQDNTTGNVVSDCTAPPPPL